MSKICSSLKKKKTISNFRNENKALRMIRLAFKVSTDNFF